MPHTTRFNYKAKATTTDRVETRTRELEDNYGIHVQSLEKHLNHVSDWQAMIVNLAELTRTCAEFLDENCRVGETVIAECGSEVDSHLPNLTVPVILKRSTQIIQLMGQRLEIAVGELGKFERLIDDLHNTVATSTSYAVKVQKTLASTQYIGRRPTSPEIEEATEKVSQGQEYHRYEVCLSDDSDDDEDEYIANGT